MRWLHISDLHFGYDAATVETMRKKLLQKLKTIAPVDCLFITGDLRYAKTNKENYPADTLEFIRDLQETLHLAPKDTFMVPGNHDVNRNDLLRSGIEDAKKAYSTSSGAISEDTLAYIKQQRQPFLLLYQEICGQEEPGWHYCIPKNGFNIICLNTALFCCKDDEDGGLVIGSKLLNQLSKSVDNSRPGIVLAHHDFDSLRQEEQQNLEIALKDMGAILYLCGHKHVALSRCQNVARINQDLFVFLCGTNMDKSPMLEQTDMDFFVGEIDDAGQHGFVHAFKWSRRSQDWMPDSDFSFPQDGATDGKYFFPPDARPMLLRPIKRNILEQYRLYIHNQCSEIDLNGLPTNAEDVVRRYELTRIFVPLAFKQIPTSNNPDFFEGLDNPGDINDYRKNTAHGSRDASLDEIIPAEGCFHNFILSDPGGGKTTLLKLIAFAYCFPNELNFEDFCLPKRDLFPIWIRCRDFPKGSRLSVWSAIKNIAQLGEWMPGDSTADDFMNLVIHHIKNCTALILIDGLDEIGNDSERSHFINQLNIFTNSFPMINTIITSRITGFHLVVNEALPNFKRYEIAPLDKNGVKLLCINWYKIVYGEQTSIMQKAKDLADRITSDRRIFHLAKNPLMLTTLLLVERRVGKLPTKRAALYSEAIQVLLETWNQTGHEEEKIDLEEAKYQLAYVAFQMMKNHTQRITKKELINLLRSVRRDFSDLISNGETISAFINNIEKRSALLIQKGYEQSENSTLEAVYEFQHLTFQEYLAAYAVANRCYPGLKDEDCYGTALMPYLSDSSMREVISLTAVLNRFSAKEFTDEIFEILENEKPIRNKYNQLRSLMLQFVADEVQLKEEIIDRIFDVCFVNAVWFSDIEILRQILEGRYASKLNEHFKSMDKKYYNGYAHWTPILLLLSGRITDPYQYYMDNKNAASIAQKHEAISVLGHGFWIEYQTLLSQLSEIQLNDLKTDLFTFAKIEEQYFQKEILFALKYMGLLKTEEDFLVYSSICFSYMNKYSLIPPLDEDFILYHAISISEEDCIYLTDNAFQNVYKKLTLMKYQDADDYTSLIALALLFALNHIKNNYITDIFALIRDTYDSILKVNPSCFIDLIHYNYHLSETLQKIILLKSCYLTEEKLPIKEHILKIDLASALWMKENREPNFGYNDCSLSDETTFQLSSENNSYDDVIEYIHNRLKKLGL